MMYAKTSGTESRCLSAAGNPMTEIAFRAALSPAGSSIRSLESKSIMVYARKETCGIEILIGELGMPSQRMKASMNGQRCSIIERHTSSAGTRLVRLSATLCMKFQTRLGRRSNVTPHSGVISRLFVKRSEILNLSSLSKRTAISTGLKI